jgi:hypothetical protein
MTSFTIVISRLRTVQRFSSTLGPSGAAGGGAIRRHREPQRMGIEGPSSQGDH